MKKVRLDNVYESHLPPSNVNVLWADKDESTGDIRAIHRHGKDGWEPYLISYDYLKPDEPLPGGWNRAFRKTFQVESYKTFIQQYADGIYNGTYYVVAILVPELEESAGFVTEYSDSSVAIVDNEDASITVLGNLVAFQEYPIRVVLTPSYTGPYENHTTVNESLQVSITLNN